MTRVFAINGSPRKERGYTGLVLDSFIQGLKDEGAEIELFYTSELKIRSCICNTMYCWYDSPGECCIKNDDMSALYPRLKEANILIIATPVYVPLPGEMQNFMNRLCQLIEPYLEFRDGRTRARLRKGIKIEKFVVVTTGGWWEKENCDTVVRIVEDFTETAGAEFAGAILRPHAFLMKREGKLTEEGEKVLRASREAGNELIREGKMSSKTLEAISKPLVSEKELRTLYNQLI